MARPKVDRTPISLKIRSDVLALVDVAAAEAGLSRTAFIESLAQGTIGAVLAEGISRGIATSSSDVVDTAATIARSAQAPRPVGAGKHSYDPVPKPSKK